MSRSQECPAESMLVIIRVPGTAPAERGGMYVVHRNTRVLSTALPNTVAPRSGVRPVNARAIRFGLVRLL